MSPELEKLLGELDGQADQARHLDSVALMDGCYMTAREALITQGEVLKTLARLIEEARKALLTSRVGR